MSPSSRACLAVLAMGWAAGAAHGAPTRAKDLFEHPEWIGKEIVVDIFEPLYDADHSSAAKPGEYDVELADGPRRLLLAPGDGLPRLPTLVPPIRVRAKLSSYARGLRLGVHDVTQLAFPRPQRIANAAAILSDRARWAKQLVELEDDYHAGFEASLLGDRGVWLDVYPSARVRCAAKHDPDRRDISTARVRVVGFAHTAGHYGHLSRREGLIQAIELVYLDPARPECR